MAEYEPKHALNESVKPIDDPVNHPSHYTSGKIEVKDFIRDQKLNFSRGNAIKYVARAGKKDPEKEIQDLEKAVFYLNDEIRALYEEKGVPTCTVTCVVSFEPKDIEVAGASV